MRVQRFDVDALLRDRDQLWAEAAEREATGESIRLDPDLWQDASDHQEQRRAADPWEEVLDELLEAADVVRVDGVLADAVSVGAIWGRLGVEANHRDNRHADRVATILQRHGFTTRKKFRAETGAKPYWYWLRVPARPKERAE